MTTLDEDSGQETQEAPFLDSRDADPSNRHQRAIFDLPVDVVIAVGRARPTVKELLQMRRDSLITLDAELDDPVEVMVGKRVIARGQLQEMEDAPGQLGVRLTEIVDAVCGDTGDCAGDCNRLRWRIGPERSHRPVVCARHCPEPCTGRRRHGHLLSVHGDGAVAVAPGNRTANRAAEHDDCEPCNFPELFRHGAGAERGMGVRNQSSAGG